MRSPAKKQGLPTPSHDNRKGNLTKLSPKKSDEKDNAKRRDEKSSNNSPNSSALRKNRLSKDSNEVGPSRKPSTSSEKPQGRSCSLTTVQDEQSDSPRGRDKKCKSDESKTKIRSVSKSPQKTKGKLQIPPKDPINRDSVEKPIKAKGKRGRPPKQSYSRNNVAKTIERVIEKYNSLLYAMNAKKVNKPISRNSKISDESIKLPNNINNSQVNISENNLTKKKRGRPKGSKNIKVQSINIEKHLSAKDADVLIEESPYKKIKLNIENDEESKSRVKLKQKKSMTKKCKFKKTSLKKGLRLSKEKTSSVKLKLVGKVTTGIKRSVGRPKKVQNKASVKIERKNKKRKDIAESSEDGEITKYRTSNKFKCRSPSRDSDKFAVKEKHMHPIKKKYKREYFSESENTSGKDEDDGHVPVIKNPKKAFRDKWKREMKQKCKAEKLKEKESTVEVAKKQKREIKSRAVTFDLSKTYDFTDSEDEADKDTDSERDSRPSKYNKKKKAPKKKKSQDIPPLRRTARMASLNAIAMMHLMNEDAKVSFSSTIRKDELVLVPRKESTIARRHSDSDTDDSDSDTDHREKKPCRGRPRNKSSDTSDDKPPKKRKRIRNELGVTMDIREMVVKKRMASLNASAIMAASYSMESRSRRMPTSNSSENDATDVDIKQKISYKSTKEENLKTRSVVTVQETTKKVKKAQGRRETEVEEHIIFKKKVKRRSGIESTDTDKDDNATDVSENESERLPKTPDSGVMFESTITYVTTQTVTVPKSATGNNKYCLSSQNDKTPAVQQLPKKPSAPCSSPTPQQSPREVHDVQLIATPNQHSINPNQKYSPLGALSEMHPIMHPHLPPPHAITFPPQHHMLPPPQQHSGVTPYHHLGSHPVSHHPIASIAHHASPYPPLSPHSPPYPPPPKSSPNSPIISSSPSSTPHSYGSSPPYPTPASQSSPSISPKSSVNFIVPISSSQKVVSQVCNATIIAEEQRSKSANLHHGGSGNTSCERHNSAFTAPTQSALSPVAGSHGYQPVSGPMPTGNTPSSSSYKPHQQGSLVSTYGSPSPRVVGPAKSFKNDYYPVPPHPSYHSHHSYPYDKYLRGPPYQFYQHHYPPPGGQFGTQGEYNYPAPPPTSGPMHCSQEYAYTLCIPGPPPPQSHHQSLALRPPSSSSAPPNVGPQYYHYPDYAPVFAYPSPGTQGQNAICCSPSKNTPPSPIIGSGKGPESENRETWTTGVSPYSYQYYNPPNNHSFPPYASYQHQSSNDISNCDKQPSPQRKTFTDGNERKEDVDKIIKEKNNGSTQISRSDITHLSKISPSLPKTSSPDNNAKQNGIGLLSCKQNIKDISVDCAEKIPDKSNLEAISFAEKDTKLSASCESSSDVVEVDGVVNSKPAIAPSKIFESNSDSCINNKINHIVPLSSASNSFEVPIVQSLKTSDELNKSVPWICPSVEERLELSNSLKKANCSDFSYTSTTSTISLSSSEVQCSSVKSSANPLVTSAEVNNWQDRTFSDITNGSESPNTTSERPSLSDENSDHIKEPKKSIPDQRSGIRHLLCQSQPLSHSKSTSVLVKAKPSNLITPNSVTNISPNKNDVSLDKSNNFTNSSPKNFYARSSEISTDETTDNSSVLMKEGRNLTQTRKRGRPPKSKNLEQIKNDVISLADHSNFFQSIKNKTQNIVESSLKLLPESLDQNLNSVDNQAVHIKGDKNNTLKMESGESVKIEFVSGNSDKITKSVPVKSLNGGFNKLYDNLADNDLKNAKFSPIWSVKLLERMNSMKHEDDNLPNESESDVEMRVPNIQDVVKELNCSNLLSKTIKFPHKTGKVGRPSKKMLGAKLRRNVSLLSFLKDKNNESDTSLEMEINSCNEKDDNSPDKNDCTFKRSTVPFPPTSAQLQRKRRCSGHMKNKTNKKPKYPHGWSWKGQSYDGKVWLRNDENLYPRKCYKAIQHKLGDCLRLRDCVLLRSGTRKTDLPYVAKIAALWEDADTNDMMMSILWYYRPEHTEIGRRVEDLSDEIFASKHRDHMSVACIDDRCYVLTYNEYCRYRCKLRLFQMRVNPSSSLVPQGEEEYIRVERQPNGCVVQDLLFVCRKVYDYRQRRILKNPC